MKWDQTSCWGGGDTALSVSSKDENIYRGTRCIEFIPPNSHHVILIQQQGHGLIRGLKGSVSKHMRTCVLLHGNTDRLRSVDDYKKRTVWDHTVWMPSFTGSSRWKTTPWYSGQFASRKAERAIVTDRNKLVQGYLLTVLVFQLKHTNS